MSNYIRKEFPAIIECDGWVKQTTVECVFNERVGAWFPPEHIKVFIMPLLRNLFVESGGKPTEQTCLEFTAFLKSPARGPYKGDIIKYEIEID